MAENCSSLKPWVFPGTCNDGLWMSDAFVRDTETVARALQMSMAASSSSSSADHSSSTPSTPAPSPIPFAKNEHQQSDFDSGSRRPAVAAPGPSGKLSKKRRSRASKRTPTTFIAADPANFRQMVQQVTGVRLSDEAPPADTAFTAPGPQKTAVGGRVAIPQSCLPTLDTSAFLLAREVPRAAARSVDRAHLQQQQTTFPAADAGVGLFDLDASTFQCSFPTLESWSMM